MSYRLIRVSPPPEQVFPIEKDSITIGRAPENDVQIVCEGLSRTHARLQETPEGCVVSDQGSTNGIFVNGKPVTSAVLKPGDEMRLGDCLLRLEPTSHTTGFIPKQFSERSAYATLRMKRADTGKGSGANEFLRSLFKRKS